MLETDIISFEAIRGGFSLLKVPILVDKGDFDGVHIAAHHLSQDFAKVTDDAANQVVTNVAELHGARKAIIIGTLERSITLQSLSATGKLELSTIANGWECFTTQLIRDPFPGCDAALVIAGSDKRGAIFGTYTISNQIGISPWYFWSDVPPQKHSNIFARDVQTRQGPPSVKYRGIFINDEAPALSGWVHENYGDKFNTEFYKNVFELLLRLKANFLWPAMWFGFPHPGQSFFVDDPLNQEMADKYGIVISTSHHEPMQRAANEWFSEPYHQADGSWSWLANREKITKFFNEGAERAKPYESYITVGMRGEGDRKIVGSNPQAVISDVLKTQREIFKHHYGKEDGPNQVIALYKEVQQQFSAGLDIPGDITLLFSDDNYGTARRLPYGDELKRSGGSGIYYHFEYVGHPRSYTWLNSNHVPKVQQQLSHAYTNGARQIWVFNVGDLKPMEIPLTFALMHAWDVTRYTHSNLDQYFGLFARNTFGSLPNITDDISSLLCTYDRLVALRKHDHIEPDSFSLAHYSEAEVIEKQWKGILSKAEALYVVVDRDMQAAFYELVLHPIKATTIFISLRVAQAKNRLYALQRRNEANHWAEEVLRLFNADADLSQEYHRLLNGRWNHIMRQPHLGYRELDYAPSRNMIEGVSYVQTREDSNPIMGHLGIAVENHAGTRPGLICEEADRTHPTRRDLVPSVTLPPLEPFGAESRWFEIFSRSTREFIWTLSVPYPWVRLSRETDIMKPHSPSARIEVSIDWPQVPDGFEEEILIEIRSSMGDFDYVHAKVVNRTIPSGFTGFVESDGYVSLHATKCVQPDLSVYQILPFLGRTGDGAVGLQEDIKGPTGFLSYPFHTFTSAPDSRIVLYFTFTLDTNPERPLTYDVVIDDGNLETHRLVREPVVAGDLPPGWLSTVMDCAWTKHHNVDLGITGTHLLKIRLNEPNCLLEKVVVDLGGVKESYIGPPQSLFIHL
ncbi:hypothetical protein PFICI_09403 [Pestalotiopsis fici W106-1]|uniref:Gylcosyl hydrolase 115 C-terminal domain-containing protein n=1 Tax=Pestalotiopsis fici (strain W106-1 / CGMCC3.15140) TaxID=1229662 RepID=W3X0C3_PESFW|nr:uncharacterized protein PFICI_09403 [Pestalotiopsis fici W106-1]ETS79550.1 hypothetical protein PFICI_09403 [Pestalotiopsis fici W106-1]